MKHGFIKVAVSALPVTLADPAANAAAICSVIEEAAEQGVKLLVLPELCVTGATCGDLFYSETLLDAAEAAVADTARFSRGKDVLVVLGAPLRQGSKLYNCAVALRGGELLAVVPKHHVAADQSRWFSAGADAAEDTITLGGETLPFGVDLLLRHEELRDYCVAMELGDAAQLPFAPSESLTLAGATIVACPAAAPELVGSAQRRRLMLSAATAKQRSAYVYAGAGEGESTTDMVYAGHGLVAEDGEILAERLPFGGKGLAVSDVDVSRLAAARRRQSLPCGESVRIVPFAQKVEACDLCRPVAKNPFVCADDAEMTQRCEQILWLQSEGLRRRLAHIHAKTAVVGISGGLDSCLALLVMVRAFDRMGRDRRDILAVTMPCFGTTGRTRSNAEIMCRELGVSFREVDIGAAVTAHLKDIGHDVNQRNVTYENAQARERTQVLMDVANDLGGIVVGTGDLSELALGWATYNGDHMSMYGVNGSVTKTLVRRLVEHEARRSDQTLAACLRDILDTPVSPELLPAEADGSIAQKTEDLVGPYELHDFFLYYVIRYGFAPDKIFRLAQYAFAGEYDDAVIKHWLQTFLRRFFAQQFKRSCLPDGPKVGTVSLSPRGDWSMPTDAFSAAWLKEAES